MITLDGTALASGVARGIALTFRPTCAEHRAIGDARSPEEQFRTARQNADAALRRALDVLPPAGPACQIVRAHLLLLSDPMLAEAVESRITSDRISVSDALNRTAAFLCAQFDALNDPALQQRAADLRDVCDCIASHLPGASSPAAMATEPRVICAADLSPAQVLHVAQSRPLAFVLEGGARTSHAAILIRALAVPAVIGVRGATALVRDGDVVCVDGDRGQVLVRPDGEMALPAPVTASVVADADPHPAVTHDGVAIAVTATIGHVTDVARAIAAGADGIGLLRTEMLFLGDDQLPSEETQHAVYRDIERSIGSRPLTVRLFDFGADKRPPGLQLPDEPNPALGVRGVRVLLACPELAVCQLRALFRAHADRHVRLLVPMAVDPMDLSRVRDLVDEASRGVPVPRLDIGVLVETPAAAVMADELAVTADFLSIGTNDLAQYVLAADRDATRLGSIYQPLHPAVLRLVRDVVSAANRRRKPVSICGEAAADPRAVSLFVGMGVTELSVPAPAVARVKARVRRIDAAAAKTFVEEVLALPTADAVVARLETAREEADRDVRETCHPL